MNRIEGRMQDIGTKMEENVPSVDEKIVIRGLARLSVSPRFVACLIFLAVLSYLGHLQFGAESARRSQIVANMAELVGEIKASTELDRVDRIRHIVSGSMGFQTIEPDLRKVNRPMSVLLGGLWADIRRDAIEYQYYDGKVTEFTKTLVAEGIALSDSTQPFHRLSGLFQYLFFGFLGSAFFALFKLKLHAIDQEFGRVAPDSRGRVIQSLHPDLMASKTRLRHILMHIPIPAARFDASGMVSVWNPSLERLTGITSEDATDQPILGLLQCHLPSEVVKRDLMRVFSGEFVPGLNWKFRHSSGLDLVLRVDLVPINNVHDNAVGAVAFILDDENESRSHDLISHKDSLLKAISAASPFITFSLDAANEITALDGSNESTLRPPAGPQEVWQSSLPSNLSAAILKLARQVRLERIKQEASCTVTSDGSLYEVRLYSAPCAMAEVVVMMSVEQIAELSDLQPLYEVLSTDGEGGGHCGYAISWNAIQSQAIMSKSEMCPDSRTVFGRWSHELDGCIAAYYSETELKTWLIELEIDESLIDCFPIAQGSEVPATLRGFHSEDGGAEQQAA